jgi:hypothetical protein
VDIDPLAYYLHTASDWGGTLTIKFEAELMGQWGIDTAYAALATAAGTVVAEVSTRSKTPVRLRSAAVSLSDATKYKVMVKNSSNYVYLSSARVLIFVSSPTKLAIPRSVLQAATQIGTTAGRSSDFIAYDPADYQGVTLQNAPAQYMLRANSGITVTGRLYDGAATSRQVTSASGGHDLYVSTAEALPSTAKNFQWEVVASAYLGLNRIRLARLIIIVERAAQVFDETGKLQILRAVTTLLTQAWIVGETGKMQTNRVLQARTDTFKASDAGRMQVVKALSLRTDTLFAVNTGLMQAARALTTGTDKRQNQEGSKLQIVRGQTSATDLRRHGETGRIQPVKAIQAKTETGTFTDHPTQTVRGLQAITDTARFTDSGKSQIARAVQTSSDHYLYPETGKLQRAVVVQSATSTAKFADSPQQIARAIQSRTDTLRAVDQQSAVVRAVTVRTDAARFAESGRMQTARALQMRSDGLVFPETGKMVIGRVLSTKSEVAKFVEQRQQIARALQSSQQTARFVDAGKAQVILVRQTETDWRVISESMQTIVKAATAISELLRLGELARIQVVRVKTEMYDISAQRALHYEGFVDLMDEIDDRVIQQLVRADVLRPFIASGLTLTFTATEYTIAPGVVYIPSGRVETPEIAFTPQNTGQAHTEYVFVDDDGAVRVSLSPPTTGLLVGTVSVDAAGQATGVTDERKRDLVFLVDTAERVKILTETAASPTKMGVGGTPTAKLHIYSGDLAVDNANRGVILKDANGHYWRKTVTTTGTIVVTDLGTTLPP